MSTTMVTLPAELTIFTAADCHQILLTACKEGLALTVDLGEVGEIDGAGLQLLIATRHQAMKDGLQLTFTNHSAAVLSLLDLCDLGGFFGDPVIISKGELA
ncbi:STAS domain-containing protein [Leeia sp. TBRC 13508]|uniref:STAS domain-containing protein n=1 Tax=Leeia speluncae TaxID=2884804 RepID=A0ABS8D6Y5_9NEIS|nr:STAS domain-containing protein [Leeia speluncae]MCB6183960.1 STAS domain-containing protein [Leeia speluncae]